MRKTRIILVVVVVALIAALFLLPKSVVENESQLRTAAEGGDQKTVAPSPHKETPKAVRSDINRLRARYLSTTSEQKNAIFADSLADRYRDAGIFDSAAWFAERATTFFKTDESLMKAADAYYQAYTFAIEPEKQLALAAKAREWYELVLTKHPSNLDAKTKMAMTYLNSSPMKGVSMLREVVAADPRNELALFNLGMLSVQSGQYGKAVDWLEKLVGVNEKHLQGQLLLGVAYMNTGQKEKARQQFEKVKKMDSDPSVQATVDSYLQELK